MDGRLPDFFVIGAMKAGTTSLHHYLRAHPDLFLPAVKEPNYFAPSVPELRTGGIDRSWYSGLFADAGARLAGEVSTRYAKHPYFGDVAARIASEVPHARFIYVVRHPIERIRSHHLHLCHERGETLPLWRRLEQNDHLLDVSRYRTQLDQYLRHFSRDRILVVTSEALRDDRAATVGRILDFLGVGPSPAGVLDQVHHTTDGKRIETDLARRLRRMPAAGVVRRLAPSGVRRLLGRSSRRPAAEQVDVQIDDTQYAVLVDELRREIEGLRAFLGPDFDGWGLV